MKNPKEYGKSRCRVAFGWLCLQMSSAGVGGHTVPKCSTRKVTVAARGTTQPVIMIVFPDAPVPNRSQSTGT